MMICVIRYGMNRHRNLPKLSKHNLLETEHNNTKISGQSLSITGKDMLWR